MVQLLGVGAPVAGLVYLSMLNQAALAISCLGPYMVALLAQLRSENVFQRKGWILLPHAEHRLSMTEQPYAGLACLTGRLCDFAC